MRRSPRIITDEPGVGAARVAEQRSAACPGFTLIELLMVLAIISLLVAILLPSLSLVRARARLLGCGANLRSLATAWIAYVQDHDGRFYQGPNANVNYGGWKGIEDQGHWPRPLNPWVGLSGPDGVNERTAKVFRCPADRGGIPGYYVLQKAYRVNGTSYQTNLFLIGQNTFKWPFSERTAELDMAIAQKLPTLNISQVANHSLLVLIGDYGWVSQWDPTPLPDPNWKEQLEWHGRTDCHDVAFLDGHVEYREIRKGLYVTSEYRVLPFASLDGLACRVQGPAE
jgi:prepilin-type N-terminal cleavage/methylation domain-containing protein/prepilin-type processing-associated H-X9-DG protein